ncbi:MAG: hypothetical protein ACWA49_13900, partial [Ruegeria sp.]
WGLSFAPGALAQEKAEAFCEEVRRVIEIATEEDKEMVARVQSGAAFAASEPGYLHAPLELNIREFNSYLEDRMASRS